MSNAIPSTPQRKSLLATLHLASWRGRFAWVIGILLTALLVCWLLARMTPSWYVPLDPNDDGVQQTAAQAQLQYLNFRNAAERVPLGEQRWTITQDQVNSFLAVNTAPPLNPNGTRQTLDPARTPISDPFVVFASGQVTLCARLTKLPSSDPQGGVGSARFQVGILTGPDGKPMGFVKLTNVWIGNLPVPRSLVESRLRAQAPAIIDAVKHIAQIQFGMREFDKYAPVVEQITRSAIEGRPFPLQFKVDKEFQVTELRVDDGALTIVLAPLKPAVVPPRPATVPH